MTHHMQTAKAPDKKLRVVPSSASGKTDCGDGTCGCGCGIPLSADGTCSCGCGRKSTAQ